jgi:hypothetical protein
MAPLLVVLALLAGAPVSELIGNSRLGVTGRALPDNGGVVLITVAAASLAEDANLRPGDVLLAVLEAQPGERNPQAELLDAARFRRLYVRPGWQTYLFVKRDGRVYYVHLNPPEPAGAQPQA